jgi:hypothetical protein
MNFQQQQEQLANAKMRNAEQSTVLWTYRAHPELLQCEANDRAIIEAVRAWIQDPDVLPTPSLFEDALAANPELIKQFATQKIEKTKQQILDEIIDLLATHSRRDNAMLASERARMASWSLDQLRARLDELKFKISAAGTPVSDLKQFVKDSRPVVEAKILPAEYTAKRIKNLPARDIHQLIKDYGAPQVDARMQGRN